jgi:large subunit ribosomal protein L15
MKLNEIRDNRGAHKRSKRVGRGIGSGKGKTSSSGHKGQRSRSGVSLLGFEGGQMPLYRRLPKRGFNYPFRKSYRIVNVGRLQAAIDAGRLDASQAVTEEALKTAGVVKRIDDGVRLLAKGELKAKISVEVTTASKAAVAAIEQAGGTVKLTKPVESAGAEA